MAFVEDERETYVLPKRRHARTKRLGQDPDPPPSLPPPSAAGAGVAAVRCSAPFAPEMARRIEPRPSPPRPIASLGGSATRALSDEVLPHPDLIRIIGVTVSTAEAFSLENGVERSPELVFSGQPLSTDHRSV
jgi:hypothetical protein